MTLLDPLLCGLTSVLCTPTAAEVATLRDAVKTVREAAEALQLAADEAQQPMLRLNLREARAILVCCTPSRSGA